MCIRCEKNPNFVKVLNKTICISSSECIWFFDVNSKKLIKRCLIMGRVCQVTTDIRIRYKSLHHHHDFFKQIYEYGWICNGWCVHGNCESSLNRYERIYGQARYKCTACYDFDFCEHCLNMPKETEESNRKLRKIISEARESFFFLFAQKLYIAIMKKSKWLIILENLRLLNNYLRTTSYSFTISSCTYLSILKRNC